MKVALACDHLILRDYSVDILEKLCEIFPAAPIFTFAFKEGNILGEVTQRKIYSSYLSNKIKNFSDFQNTNFLFQGSHRDCVWEKNLTC